MGPHRPLHGRAHRRAVAGHAHALASLAKQATLALPGAPETFAGFDGFLVIVRPGTAVPNPAFGKDDHAPLALPDGGATGVGQGDAVCPVATSSHTIMVPELGYVLGLRDG